MSDFPDLDSVLDPRCPIRVVGRRYPSGRLYMVPEPSVRLGLRVMRLLSSTQNTIAPAEEHRLLSELCGPVWDEMDADGVGHTMQMFAGRTVLVYYGISPTKAVTFATGGLDPGNPIPPRWKIPAAWWRSMRRSRAI